MPVFQMRKLRLKEIKKHIQGHTINKWSLDTNPDESDSGAHVFRHDHGKRGFNSLFKTPIDLSKVGLCEVNGGEPRSKELSCQSS